MFLILANGNNARMALNISGLNDRELGLILWDAERRGFRVLGGSVRN